MDTKWALLILVSIILLTIYVYRMKIAHAGWLETLTFGIISQSKSKESETQDHPAAPA